MRRCRSAWVHIAAALLTIGLSRPAHAGKNDVVLVPTLVARATDAGLIWERPSGSEPSNLSSWARYVDGLLGEGVQDLGLTLDVSHRINPEAVAAESDLALHSLDSWIVSPRLRSTSSGKLELRILAVSPGSQVVLLRINQLTTSEVEVRALVMLRDLVETGRRRPGSAAREAPPAQPEPALVYQARSPGRAVLALHGAVLGGYAGLSLQRASGSTDARLTYPLIALGAGIGLGGSMIIADEWDVGLGDAWYLSAAMLWPGAAGLLLAESYNARLNDRYIYGLVGAGSGLALATVSLSFKGMSDGGAVVTHSGGGFGLILGGLAQLIYEGKTDVTPTRGMGYGAAAGVLSAGVLATQVEPLASRVLWIDVGASLGGLTGAAVASPLLVIKGQSSLVRNRVWLASIGAGMLSGGVLAWWLTRPAPSQVERRRSSTEFFPWAGVVGFDMDAKQGARPIYGAGVLGSW